MLAGDLSVTRTAELKRCPRREADRGELGETKFIAISPSPGRKASAQLAAVNIQVDGFDDNIKANLSGGEIASLGLPYAPCTAGGSCRITGYWADSP